jgi:hypothetical protein
VAGSIDRRIQRLEDHYHANASEAEERAARAASRKRGLEKTEREFSQRVERLKSAAGLDLGGLRGKPPMEIAAAYVVLMHRGEREMAAAVKDLYDDVKEERSRWPASVELERWAPGIGRWYDSWFWEIVERHAHSPSEPL